MGGISDENHFSFLSLHNGSGESLRRSERASRIVAIKTAPLPLFRITPFLFSSPPPIWCTERVVAVVNTFRGAFASAARTEVAVH